MFYDLNGKKDIIAGLNFQKAVYLIQSSKGKSKKGQQM